jgi:hypothetical protein
MTAESLRQQLRDIAARASRARGRAEHVLEHAAEVRRRDDTLSARITPPGGEDFAIALLELVEDMDGARGIGASGAWENGEWVITLFVAMESAS